MTKTFLYRVIMVSIFRNITITRTLLYRVMSVAVFFGMPGTLCAKTAGSFRETVCLESSGRASVVWTITELKDTANEVLLPWNFAQNPETLNVSPANRFQSSIVVLEGTMFLSLRSNKSINCDTVTIVFAIPDFFLFETAKRLDFGNIVVKKTFINTTLFQIHRLSSELFLPSGYVIAMVDETLPEKPSGESASPFEIIRNGDRNGIAIGMDNARLGDAISVKFKIKSSAKSPFMLIMFLCIGIAYLVAFRDIIRTTTPVVPPSSSH